MAQCRLVLIYDIFLCDTGTGLGGISLTSIVIVQHHFNEKRALASGIGLLGGSVGTVVFVPCFRFLVDILGWRIALICHAGLVSQTVVLGALLRPGPIENKIDKHSENHTSLPHKRNQDNVECALSVYDVTQVDGSMEIPSNIETNTESESKMTIKPQKRSTLLDTSVLRIPAYVIYLLGVECFMYGIITMYQHTASRAVTNNISKMQAAMLPVSVSVSSTAFRIIGSFAANHRKVDRFLYMAVLVTCGGIVVGLSGLTSNTFLGSMVICLLYGVFSGQYFHEQIKIELFFLY